MLASGPLLCSLITALQVTTVTAGGDGGPKTRVRGIDFAGEGCIGASTLPSSGRHPGNWYGYDETAVDPSRQYNGRVYDSGTGFHDYGARLYWPEIGRFISVDSAKPDLANPLSFNRYSYTFNNPYKYVDPDGRTPLVVVGLACAAAGFVGSMIGSYIDTGEVSWNAATQWAAKGFLIGVTAGLGATMLADSEATTTAAQIATTAGPGTVALAKQAEPALSQAGQALMRAEPVGSALKGDVYHRPATFMREIAARIGTHFEITGGDGAKRTLTQVLGKLNDTAGRYEYIVDEAGKLTHQMFVEGGTINGVPIKP